MTERLPSSPAPILRGERVILRPTRPSDAADRVAAGRDPELVWAYGGDPASIQPMTPEDGEAFYRRFR